VRSVSHAGGNRDNLSHRRRRCSAHSAKRSSGQYRASWQSPRFRAHAQHPAPPSGQATRAGARHGRENAGRHTAMTALADRRSCPDSKIDAMGPGCVKTLRGISAPVILRLVVTLRAQKRKFSSSARHCDQISFRFHTGWAQSGERSPSASLIGRLGSSTFFLTDYPPQQR
jgi:hypothetical protein